MGRGRRGFGAPASLPNAQSKHKTVASVYYDHHYARLDLLGRWNWERFARLCQFLKQTPHELGSLVLLSHAGVEYLKANNHLGPGCAANALVLTLLEARVLREWSKDIIPNPFPDMQESQ